MPTTKYKVKEEHKIHFSLLIRTLKPDGMIIEGHDKAELQLIRDAGVLHWIEPIKEERVRGWFVVEENNAVGPDRKLVGPYPCKQHGAYKHIYIDAEIE